MDKQEIIIAGLKAGQDDAYKYVYNNYYKLLCYVAYEYLYDYSLAEMMVSDVIFVLWEKRDKLDIKSSLRYYLIRSVKNRCISYLRNNPRVEPVKNIPEDILLTNEYTDYSHPLTEMIEKELDIKLKECINSLPELTRRIYILKRFENKKYDEIARLLNISKDVVKYHMKSAIWQLKEGMKDYFILFILLKNPFL